MDNSVKELAQQMAEAQLANHLWNLIKKDWWTPSYVEKISIDDNKKVFIGKMEGSIIFVGYIHIFMDADVKPLFAETLLNSVNNIHQQAKEYAFKTKINSIKIMTITTYKLSHYQNVNFSKFPVDREYYFMTESNKPMEKKHYELQHDTSFKKNAQSDGFIDSFLENLDKF